jgi:hypothetical protein
MLQVECRATKMSCGTGSTDGESGTLETALNYGSTLEKGYYKIIKKWFNKKDYKGDRIGQWVIFFKQATILHRP